MHHLCLKFHLRTNPENTKHVLKVNQTRMRFVLAITIFTLIGSLSSINLNAQCSAGFNDSIDSLTLYITNQSTGGYNYIEYDYGDGNYIVQVPNPTHTYSSSGIYEVCQIIYDTISFMCFDYTCDTIIIGNATCGANFWWAQDEFDVEFFNVSIGSYDSVYWDFGDGNGSSQNDPVHQYDSAGLYTVCLSLYDTAGSICDSTCYPLYIDTNDCDADFSFSTDGLTVDFTNESSGGYQAVYWEFGDMFGSSEDEDPTYTYFTAGTYEVCLYIYDTLTGSCYDEICKEVTVTGGGGGGGCTADFEYEVEHLLVDCQNTSTGNYLTAIFDYGDGSTPTIAESHEYQEPGTYEVCLTVGNIIPFCLDQYCQEVTVYEFDCEPTFTYSFDPNSNVFSFANTTTVGNYTSVVWEFGDGNTSTFANPAYTYNVPGTYEVCLNTYDDENLCGVSCKELVVYPLGVNEVSVPTFNLHPNPSRGELVLSFDRPVDRAKVILSDLSGREIDRSVLGGERVQFNYNVPQGTYLLSVEVDGISEVRRIVILD